MQHHQSNTQVDQLLAAPKPLPMIKYGGVLGPSPPPPLVPQPQLNLNEKITKLTLMPKPVLNLLKNSNSEIKILNVNVPQPSFQQSSQD